MTEEASVGFMQDEYARSEIKAYREHSRSNKVDRPKEPQRQFIFEQEAARLHCEELIGLMNAIGSWGR